MSLSLRARSWLATTTALLLAGSALAAVAPPASAATDSVGTTYYVDPAGDDSASGTTETTAWKTLDKVNATTFQPGDRIEFRSGETWTGQLWPKGSGSAEAPIVIESYGSGAKPAIQGNGTVHDAVRLFNQSYWSIKDLDVSNQKSGGATAADNLGDFRGIHVSGDNSTTLNGFTIDGVDVHDVTGEVNWISGSTSGNSPGIHFATGWDGSKKTGGIVFDTTVPDVTDPPSTPTVLNGITVENSTVINTSFAGIVVKQYTGDGTDGDGNTIATATGWGTRTSATDTKFAPHTNVTIRGNYLRQDGTSYGCNGIYLTDTRGGLIEDNTIYRAGTSGIEMYFSDQVTVQHNEVYETQQKAGGADSNGIDPDKGTTGIVVQSNYLHGNGDGVLICQFAFGDALIRNNVIVDNKRYPIYLHSDKASKAKVYNNTIYNSASSYLIYGYGSSLAGSYDIENNVLYSTKANATLTTSPTITYKNNLYGGAALTIPDSDSSALVGDPLFVAPAPTGPYGTPASGPQLTTANAFAVSSGSKAVNRAIDVSPAAGEDYAGSPVPSQGPDLGAFEYSTPAGATTESVSGFVHDGSGRALDKTTVKVTVGAASKTATTDATGWYRVTDVPFGTATVAATRTGYSGDPVTAAVSAGTSTNADLELASTSTEGTLSGRVLDVTGAPLAGATITVTSGGGDTIATASSNGDGTYSATASVGDGYTVTASKDGLRSAAEDGLGVDPAADTAVSALLLQPSDPTTLFADDFESRPLGALPTTDGYTVSQSGGSAAVVAFDGSQALKLTRSTNSGSTSVQRNYGAPLTGLVTVEARIMRNDPTTSSANWFSVPYLYGTDGKPAVSVAFSKGQIVAYQGTASSNLQPYALGQWYKLTLQVDTVNQSFSLLIDGKTVVDHAAFRSPLAGGIARIEWYANSSNYGSVHVDDIRILQGTDRDKSNADIATVTTDAGQPVRSDDGWQLNVPARTSSLRVTATPAAAVIGGLTVAGAAAVAGVPSDPVPLAEGGNDIPIVVTAEDGTTKTTVLHVDRALLAADSTLSGLSVADAGLAPAFDADTLDYSATLPAGAESAVITAVPTGPDSSITIGGKAAASGAGTTVPVEDGDTVTVAVASADGTGATDYTIRFVIPAPPVIDPSAPAEATLSTTAGWSGLQNGDFDVRMDLWWGTNGRTFRLFQNGELIATVPLVADGLNAQHASVPVSRLLNGDYTYTGELVNTAGKTATTSVIVHVTQAAPAVPALRAQGSGSSYTFFTDLWWGTNATSYKLYDNGTLVDTQTLTAATPGAQHAQTTLTLTPGKHEFVSVLGNYAGTTRSKTVSLTVG